MAGVNKNVIRPVSGTTSIAGIEWIPVSAIYDLKVEQGKASDSIASVQQEMLNLKVEASAKNLSTLEIRDLNDLQYKVLQPIQCVLYSTNEAGAYPFVLECVDIDMYGEGETVGEAVDDIKEGIKVFYESLVTKSNSELSDAMILKKEQILNLISKRER